MTKRDIQEEIYDCYQCGPSKLESVTKNFQQFFRLPDGSLVSADAPYYTYERAAFAPKAHKTLWQRMMDWVWPEKPRAPDLRDVNPATFYETPGGQRRDGRALARSVEKLVERNKPLPVEKVSPEHMEKIIGDAP